MFSHKGEFYISRYHLNYYLFDNFSIYFNAVLRIILLLFQIINSKATFHLPLFKKLSAHDFFSLQIVQMYSSFSSFLLCHYIITFLCELQ
nr:MAG TPA: hypothetical protein [Caudoviricetes sp.]